MRVQTFSRVQILQEFGFRCQALAANDNRGFKQEFELLNEVGKDLPTRAGDSEANREKNRYPYILPYDHCRVRLSIQNSHPHTDYINANFVPGGGSERDFICTQGPLHNTMADFWRMVWEQNVRVIVMVTALRDKDIVLCDRYWPLERRTVHHGLIQVTTVTRTQGPDYFITTINLRQRYCPTDRIITHYYYPSWPDRGIPKDPSSLCAFSDHVRQHLEAIPRLGPAVVHCSAGVGRSGTFVTLLWLMQLCARGIKPDIRAAVEDLRLHRMWMVQNLEQYMFVHQCLLQWLSGGTGGTSACSPQIQGAGSNINHHVQDRPHGSGGDRTGRRRRHRHRQKPPPDPPQNTIQQILHPGNLLRRLLPSSSPFNPGSHSS
ncbi:receptor-type tyrosine-protein phosphatase V-like isoform X1 [Seriola lalandi dorsalis]|uniref:receptor-type tyrosine-protein phosphatase V-like isoform X1 n=1 Tax=Seriola lalandi dorsalis TaxID=1841481 RepID=UPI000C6FA9D3|nr:receptor-type tyrosine-protein phosphatase V-like isoform X1 [Seriola lalandi dorsalis]XP_056241379.1 receptor-type tyrosine-protein phosphatase V-like isoform X1 [Seriola aureovittata]XP_056241380.1 receptor-type tyrosine-protein phosphatase V-like isoform X1 [Seriola aureovittata]